MPACSPAVGGGAHVRSAPRRLPTGRGAALVGLGVAGLLSGGVIVGFALASDHAPAAGAYAVLMLTIGWGFVGTGLFAWWRRPENRVGLLMTAVGFAWALASLKDLDAAVVHTIGLFAVALLGALAIHLVLVFPSGRPETPLARIGVALGYGVFPVVQSLPLLFGGGASSDCSTCPRVVAVLGSNPAVADALQAVARVVLAAVFLVVCAGLVQRWRRAAPPQRRALAPVLWVAGAAAALVALNTATESGDPYTFSDPIDWAWATAFAAVPFAFLAGVLRSRLHRGGAVTGLVERLGVAHGPGELRDALADALGDPSLDLVYWLADEGHYVDAAGRPVELPAPGSGRAVTEIRHEGRRVAAIVHEASLDEDPELVRSAGAAAALSLENERLDAELRARLEELRASRARLVEAGDAERRRIERDLHDGAQQRLVSLLLQLKLARRRGARGGESKREVDEVLLDGVESELVEALAELRGLASGVLPPVLSDRGLAAAVGELGSRSSIVVEIEAMPTERLPERAEVAAYFVVAEALTNAAKHAGAGRASVRVARHGERAVVEVRDDGVGGARLDGGSGLRGLADRVGALDGRLELESPAGRGTTVRAEIPCGR